MSETQSKESKTSKNKSSVPSVEKAFDVLELLSAHADGLTMNEIVEALGRTMGELYRIVLYLAERGYLEQNPSTLRYSLTLGLYELSHRHPPMERLLREAVPVLERIAALSEQSCHLGVLNRANVLILASVASPRPAGYSVRTGSVFAAHKTSTGMVILAHSDQDAQKRFLNRLSSDLRTEARRRLNEISERGYDDFESELVAGVRNLSSPIFDSRGIVGAITSGYIKQLDPKTTPEETLQIIRENAALLSRSLGYVSNGPRSTPLP